MNTSKLEWNKLKEEIYYWDGSWRDIYILDIDGVDWEKWVDYVNRNYVISWYNGKVGIKESQINFDVINGYLKGEHDLYSSANIFIGSIQINCHFFSESEIENDIDPREITSITDHEKIIKYMTDLSILLEKDIILTSENDPQDVLIKVNNTSLTINI